MRKHLLKTVAIAVAVAFDPTTFGLASEPTGSLADGPASTAAPPEASAMTPPRYSLACDEVCGRTQCGDLLGLGSSTSRILDGWNFRGWLNAGHIGNIDNPASHFNGPYNGVDRANEPMLNQLYLIAEKELPTCGVGLGGRIDYLYGEDYLLAQSTGIERREDGSSRWNNQYYGSAFPQAFVSIGNQERNVQMGHFYSVVGYEGVMAPANLFYSKSYSYQFAGPFTHWGAMYNAKASDQVSYSLGIHNGWDAFDRVSDKLGFIGRIRVDSATSDAWTSFAITTGEEANSGAATSGADAFTNRTRYSFLVSLPVTCRTEYVFHQWFGSQQDGADNGDDADWYGVDQYLSHRINDCWRVGARFEWFRDEEGTRVGLNRPSNPNNPGFVGDFYSLSLGAGYTPNSSLTIRPEIRADWFDGTAATGGRNPFNDGGDDDQLMIGCDVIFRL